MSKKSTTKTSPASQTQPQAAAPTKATARSLPVTSQAASSAPSREAIASRAYELYVARGQAAGREMDDWVQAERELLNRARTH